MARDDRHYDDLGHVIRMQLQYIDANQYMESNQQKGKIVVTA